MDKTSKKFINRDISILWIGVVSIISLWCAIDIPLTYALSSKISNFTIVAELLMCVCFSVDMYLRWTGQFQISQQLRQTNYHLINQPERSYKNTLWPIIDFICVIPFDLIAYALGNQILGVSLSGLRLIKMARVLKLRDWKFIIDFIPKPLKLILIALSILVALHWIACGWMIINPRSAVDDTSFYIISLYWAVATLTTVGYGDITPVNNIGRIYTMGVMIVGVGVYGIIIGNISRLMMLADKYTEEKKEKLNNLNQFMKYYNIPTSLQKQVFSFYNHLINKSLGEKDHKIIKELPQALQNELNIYTKIKLIKNVHIFRECSTPCLKMIAQRLEQTFHSPNEYIIRKGDIGEEMFILGHGKVQVSTDDKVLDELREGQFFGEIALIENTVRTADVQSMEYCDLYTFKKSDFLEVIQKYPILGEKFREVYYKRAEDSPLKDAA
jgi:voltage-gated potassium channel